MAYAASLAGSKLRAQLGSSLNEHVSAPSSDFAQRQLKQMGWTEGTGLGKRRQGRATHISVKRREDQVGLGHAKEQAEIASQQQQWWKDSMGDTLAKLSSSGTKKKKRKKESKKRKAYTDEELFEATGGARFGMRAQRRATAKWARTELSISEQDEQEAKARVEWNGRGSAQALLSSSTSRVGSESGSEKESSAQEKSSEPSDNTNRKRKVKKSKKRVEKEEEKKKKRKRSGRRAPKSMTCRT